MNRYRFLKAIKIVFFVALFAALLGWIVMCLWNALLPALFGWRTIGFVQALGLLVLSRILFGGMRSPGGWGPPWRRHMHERWAQMTPEEREKLRTGMRGRCWGGEPSESSESK